MGRGPTAYFLFSDENRASAKAELEAQPGKHGVAQVAKLIGQRWAALSDEEKQRYKERAAKLQEEAVAAAAAEEEQQQQQQQQSPGGNGDAAAAGEPASKPAPPASLPIGVVRRVVMVDGDVSRVSSGALRAIATATELFIEQLAVRAMEHAAQGKRKNFKAADVEHLASRDRRLLDMGLKEVLDELAAAATAAAAAGENDADPGSAAQERPLTKKQKREEAAAAGTRQITAFFGAAN